MIIHMLMIACLVAIIALSAIGWKLDRAQRKDTEKVLESSRIAMQGWKDCLDGWESCRDDLSYAEKSYRRLYDDAKSLKRQLATLRARKRCVCDREDELMEAHLLLTDITYRKTPLPYAKRDFRRAVHKIVFNWRNSSVPHREGGA